MRETGDDPSKIVEERGLRQTADTGAIEAVIAEVIAASADKVAEYRGGKDKLFGFFVGQTMTASGGKANPAVVIALIRKAPASTEVSALPLHLWIGTTPNAFPENGIRTTARRGGKEGVRTVSYGWSE